jgi:hypothetical protein
VAVRRQLLFLQQEMPVQSLQNNVLIKHTKILSRSHFSPFTGRESAASRHDPGVLAITVVHPDAGKHCRSARVSEIR